MNAYFTISDVARESGFSPPTLRYYEEIGILPQPRRGTNGYRLYTPDDLARLQFVRRAKLLDLSLEEIKDILAYAVDGRCGPLQQHLVSLLETKIVAVNEKIRELRRLKADLQVYQQAIARSSHTCVANAPTDRGHPSTGSGQALDDPAFCDCMETPTQTE